MSRKKKNRGHSSVTRSSRPSSSSRKRLVLEIIASDNTFNVVYNDPLMYIGKCIHCNTSLAVDGSGETSATIEHLNPLCNGGDATDPRNLALACTWCNNEKGIRHDNHAGKGGRADEVIAALIEKRMKRWHDSQKKDS